MTDYTAVQPSMLCATCPWDRSCISPPTMTRAEIDAKMAAAAAQDDAKLAALTGWAKTTNYKKAMPGAVIEQRPETVVRR